jgi:DNA-binding NarL/FixJ family response regulator
MRKIKTILMSDQILVRQCLWVILEKAPELDLAAQVDFAATSVEEVLKLHPDLVIIDPDSSDIDSSDTIRTLSSGINSPKVLIVSSRIEPQRVAVLLNAGANGFAMKSSPVEDLLLAIGTVADNGLYLPQELHGVVRRKGSIWSVVHPLQVMLTPREHGIMVLLAQGKSSRAISQELQISIKTVEAHRAHIMKKLGVSGMAALAKYALRAGFIPLD